MKRLMIIGFYAGLLILLVSGLLLTTHTTHAQCTVDAATTPIDNGADSITCTGLTGILDAQGGNDTITNSGAVSGFTIFGSTGSDSIVNTGNFSSGGTIVGWTENDTILNYGNFSGNSGINGSAGDNLIVNSGAFSGNSFVTGANNNDTISNSGAFSGSRLMGGNGNDTLTNSGAFSGGSRILGDGGSDIITLLAGSTFDANSWVDGDSLNTVSGNTDVLILQSMIPLAIPNLTPCHNLANVAAMQTNGCFLPWEGGTLYFVNFEQIQVILLAALEEQGISVSLPAVPTVICDDGRVKVFKLPNGDVEYYSGFDVNPPNGFLVGKATLAELANGVRTFSDPNALGWSVVISQDGNALSGQVLDNLGNPVGNTCRH